MLFRSGTDTLVWTSGRELPIASINQPILKDLENECFIIREQGSSTRKLFDEFCYKHHFYPKNCIEMSQPEAIRRALINNMGISLMSRWILDDDLQSDKLKILDLKDLSISRPIKIIDSENNPENTLKDIFIRFIQNHFEFLSHD